MEDLREVGQDSLDSINQLGASTVGDLVLSIGQVIDELQDMPNREDLKPGERKLKLEHLRGLFRNFAHGEEYTLDAPLVGVKQLDAHSSWQTLSWNNPVTVTLSGTLNNYVVGSGMYVSEYEFPSNPIGVVTDVIDDKTVTIKMGDQETEDV